MRVLIGRRRVPSSEVQKATNNNVAIMISGVPRPNFKEFPGQCNNCKCPLTIRLIEDLDTGEVWVEGPQECPKCEHKLLDSNVSNHKLTQKEIEQIFGV